MLLIGSHVSFKSSEQLLGSVKEAISYNSTCFMFYTGAPQNTKRCRLDYDLTLKAVNLLHENNISVENLVIHAPYIINLANNLDKDKYLFSINFLCEELNRANMLGVKRVVLHPGSFTSLSLDDGINNIINALNLVIKPNLDVSICLETMAGKGTEVGFKLEQIKGIIDGVKYNDKLMVCLDTCHLNDSGYDISNFNKFLDEFDKIIGIEKIGCVHVNDSKNVLGSRKDRHENIGFGTIGFDSLINVIYNERLENVPKILETPYINKLYPPYKFEIDMIRERKFNNNLYDDVVNYYR